MKYLWAPFSYQEKWRKSLPGPCLLPGQLEAQIASSNTEYLNSKRPLSTLWDPPSIVLASLHLSSIAWPWKLFKVPSILFSFPSSSSSNKTKPQVFPWKLSLQRQSLILEKTFASMSLVKKVSGGFLSQQCFELGQKPWMTLAQYLAYLISSFSSLRETIILDGGGGRSTKPGGPDRPSSRRHAPQFPPPWC